MDGKACAATGRHPERGWQFRRQPGCTALDRVWPALHRPDVPLPADLRAMKTRRRALLAGGIWVALLATSAAQLELKREPLPPAKPAGPEPAAGEKKPPAAPAVQQRV